MTFSTLILSPDQTRLFYALTGLLIISPFPVYLLRRLLSHEKMVSFPDIFLQFLLYIGVQICRVLGYPFESIMLISVFSFCGNYIKNCCVAEWKAIHKNQPLLENIYHTLRFLFFVWLFFLMLYFALYLSSLIWN